MSIIIVIMFKLWLDQTARPHEMIRHMWLLYMVHSAFQPKY